MVILEENNNKLLLKLEDDELTTFLSHNMVKKMFPNYKITDENDRFAIILENGMLLSGDETQDEYVINEKMADNY